ncbi:MAG: arginase [Vicinamibacterales bacterium]
MVRRPIHIIGVPLDLGQGRRGVDMGPSALRIAGIDQRIAALGHPVVDRGDLHVPIPETRSEGDPRKKYIREIARVCQRLHHAVFGSLRGGAIPVVLGGDHSLGAGSVAAASDWAHQRGEAIGLIWVDAHGDMNTPASSASGNVHGMPLAALVGPEPQELARLSARVPAVDPSRTVLLGIRDLDGPERENIRRSGVRVFTMSDIDRQGMAEVAQQALAAAGADAAGIHVSFDMDACDPAIAPGVGTAVRGGLAFREAHLFMEMVADSGRLTSLDLVEVNPILDVQNTTATLGMDLALSALGQTIY